MRILFAAFTSGKHFLRSLKNDRKRGQWFMLVATKARFEPATELIIEIGFPGLLNRVLLRATARARKGKSQRFEVAPDEHGRLEFLVAVASGRAQAQFQRRHRRFPIEIPARFYVEHESRFFRGDARTLDIAAGGISLDLPRHLPARARITVILYFADAEITFNGTIVWNQDSGGVGVAFDRVNDDARRLLRRLIRGVKISGQVAIDEPLWPTEVATPPSEAPRRPASTGSGVALREEVDEDADTTRTSSARVDTLDGSEANDPNGETE